MLSAAEFGQLIEGFRHLNGGLEHQVFYRPKSARVIKFTRPPHFGAMWHLKGYVQNLIWCNEFLDDDIRLEGVRQTDDGMSLVISQPFIPGKEPSQEQLEEWFKHQGCLRIGPLKWQFPDGMIVGDAYPRNFILRRDGVIFPIDLHVERPPD